MPAEFEPFTHHLVGAVHVLTVFRDDRELIRHILEQERSVCSAKRVIVDLGRICTASGRHLDVIRAMDWNRDLMVRLTADRPPISLECLGEGARTMATGAS